MTTDAFSCEQDGTNIGHNGAMNRDQLTRWQSLSILGGAALMLSLAMGMRQTFGLFQPHVVRDLGITTADFSFAIAVQNIVWGLSQPVAGMIADRFGVRVVAPAGVAIYAVGLLLIAFGDSLATLVLGAGIAIGLALSCTASSVAMSVTARTVSPAKRSLAMGAVSAVGSLGLMIASPLAQALITGEGWQVALFAFLGLTAAMLPAALSAGRADQIAIDDVQGPQQSIGEALREATSHPGYVVLALAFFVCGLQLVFLTTHLPTYLDLCGIEPGVGAAALALIGLFNVGGSYLFGWLGGFVSKRLLLGGIYMLRSLAITAYFTFPPSPTSTLIFAAAMGTLWLGVVPLVNGLIVQLFGLRYVATLSGVAFFSHQVGSFIGAWGGGALYQWLGSYDYAWKSAVAIGMIAGACQMAMNLRPAARLAAPEPRPAAGG